MPRNNVRRANLPTAADFEQLGLVIMNRESSRACEKTKMRRFKAFFGAEPKSLAQMWRHLHKSGWLRHAGHRGAQPVHLLWTFLWLRCCDVEEVGASTAGVDEKTHREWVWLHLEGMAGLVDKFASMKCCQQCVAVTVAAVSFSRHLAHLHSLFVFAGQVGEQICG